MRFDSSTTEIAHTTYKRPPDTQDHSGAHKSIRSIENSHGHPGGFKELGNKQSSFLITCAVIPAQPSVDHPEPFATAVLPCPLQVADVLALVVQHCSSFVEMKAICNLLKVSSSVRQQLLRVRGHGHVYFAAYDANPMTWTSQVAQFAQWLPRHAGLVASLYLTSVDTEQNLQVLQQLCALALRVCNSETAAMRLAAAVPDPAAVPATAILQPLRLKSVDVDWDNNYAEDWCPLEQPLLQQLAGVDVQELSLRGCALQLTDTCSALLGRLTALEVLRCEDLQPQAVQALSPTLRSLTCEFWAGAQDGSSDSSGSNCVDLRHLTRLQSLSLHYYNRGDVPRLELLLPPQLTHLNAGQPVHKFSGATRLQSLALFLMANGLLPSLSGLSDIKQLRLLIAVLEDGVYTGAEQAAAAIRALKSLTSLSIHDSLSAHTESAIDFGRAGLCAALVSLPDLHGLHLRNVLLPSHDLLRLSALTALRHLSLDGVQGCDDAVAAALTSSLIGLTGLKLKLDEIKGAQLLTAVGSRLTGLCSLHFTVAKHSHMGDADLLQLSRLTQLTSLGLLPLTCSDVGMQQFLAGMPGLQNADIYGDYAVFT
jgi:hypothetical protein